MDVRLRNNVNIIGDGQTVMVMAHGFGCDQNMWRFLTPSFTRDYKLVLFDLVGSGKSDLTAYDYKKYSHLQGYADDLIEIIDDATDKPVIFVGHSVSTMIGLLACNTAPEKFSRQIMVAPSPCYINDGDYHGGFSEEDIAELCETIEGNYLGWSSAMAPNIMGAPDQPELSEELTNSFCRTNPDIARHFADVTFTSDHRDELDKCQVPSLILQCDDDFIAPTTVGEFMKNTMPDATLSIINNVGHCPHMSSPDQCAVAMKRFLEYQ
ncbi:alpha/beta hydrolase [Alteromonas sp. ASW11-19]|uniref:Alpha/beta hydrolase n=1 Tax=Alteromonas salexigens TaxID=2982530 RepID=A0ABT2VPH7_9ALTE|nr:alpha/beta hydrolase [Alteromonas salexigens]MCU7554141.1 alpha/beta hydrolase [Alteromonas salexigens]